MSKHEFKVGDRVRHEKHGEGVVRAFKEAHPGLTVVGVEFDSPSSELHRLDGMLNKKCGWWFRSEDILLLSKRNRSTSTQHWQFQSNHIKDVVWHEITKDLSRSNPLMLIERGEDKYVAVYRGLLNKSHAVDMPPLAGRSIEHTDGHGCVFKLVQFEWNPNFAEWVEWAKKVKAAQWPNKDKQTVKVMAAKV